MAQIREELVLYDRFSHTFTSYIRQAEMAAGATAGARTAVEELAEEQRTAGAAASSLTDRIRGLVGAYAGLQGLRGLMGISDQIASTTARLDRMNDGLQTTEELSEMIYASAMRSRGAYAETASFVAKLGTLAGDAFSSSGEIVAFAEQVNKQMVLSGTSTMEAQAAMLQLTQGLSSGALRGEELNSVLEQTPMIAQTIADHMGVTTGEMRELASEGKVTAEVVKNAMLSASEETNAAFEAMPMTWGQVWTTMQNVAVRALGPVLSGVNWLANNIEIIGPLVLGLAGAFLVFQVAAHWTELAAAATGIYTVAVNILNAAYGALTGNALLANAAAGALNATMLASPVTWIVMGVVLLIAALYAGVAAYNEFAGASISATGIVAGAFLTLGAMILNSSIIPMQRQFANFANFVGNVFHDPVAAVQVLFLDMAGNVLGYLQTVAHGIEDLINAIPGMSVDLTSGIDGLYRRVRTASQEVKDASGWTEYVKSWDYIDPTEAFQTGYAWGESFDPLGGLFGGAGGYAGTAYEELLDEVAGIGEGVDGIGKSVDMSQEDLRSLIDVAERRYVNHVNLTAQTPIITVNGANTGRTAADRQALANAIRDVLVEEASAGAVRTTARPVRG